MVNDGVCGFKCFLVHSGVDEFPCVNKAEVLEALEQLKGTGSVLLFHAEVEVKVEGNNGDPSDYQTFLNSRPAKMENDAIDMVIECCQRTGVRCHIVHLASGEAVGRIKEAQR